MSNAVYKNEYELTGFLAKEHDIVEWDQSTIINHVYTYVLQCSKTQGYGRDMELVITDAKIGSEQQYTVVARHRETKKVCDKAIVIRISKNDVQTEVIAA